MDVVVPKHGKLGEGFSRKEKFLADKFPGRQTNPKRGYQSRASWISDLVALRKVFLLCFRCRAYFNPKQHNYRRIDFGATGDCDACKEQIWQPQHGALFEPEEHWLKLNLPRSERIKAARAAAGDMSVWRAIQKENEKFPKVHRR